MQRRGTEAGEPVGAADDDALPPAPSAASLELDLPLSPVLAPPIDPAGQPPGTEGAEGSEEVLARQLASGRAALTAEPAAEGADLPLRSGSSRHLLLSSVRRPGTEVWTFGRGDAGQLGDGGTEDASTPRLVAGLRGRDVINLSAGTLHTAAVTADGELYVCGSNDASQLGIRLRSDALMPARVAALENFRVEQAACGPSHTLALVDGGALAAFGSSEFGQTGLGAAGTQVELPRVVKDLRSMRIVRAAAGGSHTLALSSTGGVFSCGNGAFGALGRGTTEGTDVPRPISRLWPLGIVQVACGEHHSAALTADDRVLTWGRGRYGALGHGNFESRSVPQPVAALAGVAGCQISCGDDHTVLLTRRGAVLAWGRGTWGQTGQSHTDNICTPQPVGGLLEGQHVVQVAAGGRHTLCLGANNQLWAFGCNGSGQLGSPPCASQPSAQLVHGLPASPILFVAAGGDHSAVVLDREGSVQPGSVGPSAARLHGEQWSAVELPNLLQLAARVAARKGERGAVEDLMAAVQTTFGSPGYLLASFAVRPAGAQQQQEQQQRRRGEGPRDEGVGDEPQPMDFSLQAQPQQQAAQQAGEAGGLDVRLIGAAYEALLRLYEPDVVAALGNTCVRLLDRLERFLNSLTQQEQQEGAGPAPPSQQQGPGRELGWLAPALFVLLQSPLNGDAAGYGDKLLMRICRVVSVTVPARHRLPVRRALTALLSRLPGDVLAARCVRPLQRHIDGCVRAGLSATRLQVMMAGVLLDLVRQASEAGGGILPCTEFHNRQLSEQADLQAEYVAWRQHAGTQALASICQMPYLLTPEAKSFIMHGEAAMQQQQHLGAAAMQALFQGISPAAVAFLHISVRRSHVVEDALNRLVHLEAEDLKKPLRVTFVSGGVPEPAQDAGGVTKEFFQLLVRDLFKPEYAMFTQNELTRTHWFNPASLEAEVEYALVGAVLGLAIYNGVILDVHLPLVAYKKLLGQAPAFPDLVVSFPDLGRGLQQLLEFEGDVEAVFCRSFTAEYNFWGEVREVDLKPGGAATPVTNANRHEFVQLYTRWLLDTSIHKQFAAFRSGFLRVCGGPALTLFSPPELELLICGLPHLDFEALEGVAKYEGGYNRDHPEVRWFWEVLHSLSLDQKRGFLRFTTGSDRAPMGGLGKLPLLIQRAGPDSDMLPTSHTCFNSLLLPEYGSKEKLRAKLLTAVENAQGFGLQ